MSTVAVEPDKSSGRAEFESTMLSYRRPLLQFARTLSKRSEQAEDLVQETLVKALVGWNTFEPGTNMKAWLFTIMRNIVYSESRKSWRTAELDQTFAERVVDPRSNQAQEEEFAQDLCAVIPLLGFLPIEMRDGVVAVHFVGMSYIEAAKVLETEVGTIKSRVSRGLSLIQDMLSEQRRHPFDLTPWAQAARNVPPNHPYFPIAKAYEELFRIAATHPKLSLVYQTHIPVEQSALDREWERLLASGVLDYNDIDLDSLVP